MNFLLDTRLNNYHSLSMNNILKPKYRNIQNNLMHIHEEGIKKKKKKKKKTYNLLPKEPKQEKPILLINKKENNICNEIHCNGKIKIKSQYLCEYHYRIKRNNIITQKVGGCAYSKECRRKIFRQLLCAKHYKEKLDGEKKLLK
jgi:hypothetical protein